MEHSLLNKLTTLAILAILAIATVPIAAQSESPAAIDLKSSAETTGPSRPLARLPMELDEGLTLIRARLEDGRVLQLAVDTGASGSVFNESIMEKLGLKFSDPGGVQARAMTASGMVDLKFLADPLKLDLAGASLEIPRPVALPLDDLARRMGRDLAGVLGRQLFQTYVVRVDYAGKKMDLFDPEKFDPEGSGVEIPVELHMGSIPGIDAEITLPDGRELKGTFLIDSGARTTLALNKPFTDKHAILDAVDNPLKMTAHGAANEFNYLVVRMQELRFAGFTVERPVTRLAQAERGALSAGSFPGVIGAQALERFTVTWDLGRKRMYLKPNAHYDRPDRLVAAGVSFIPDVETMNRFMVREVVDGSSAAEQGVRLGDRLLAIGERPAAELALPEINEILRQEGKAVRLRLARDDKEIEIVVKPRDLIPY